MNIPTYCTNCDTTEGVRLQCKGCNFARFCSRDCQKKCWKQHKRYCMPLTDAVNGSIEQLRSMLRKNYRKDDESMHCMFCLECGTSEDPLFHNGCACRPNSGMSIGHIKCFQEFARASFADDKKREDIYCGLNKCGHCSQDRQGIILFEMFIILWKLYDPHCLTRQNVQGINKRQVKATFIALSCLYAAFHAGDNISSVPFYINYSFLRVIFCLKNFSKQSGVNKDLFFDVEAGDNLCSLEKYQVAVDFNKRNYEKYLLSVSQNPELRSIRSNVVRTYANSLLQNFEASSQIEHPPYHHLNEAERLMREEFLQDSNDVVDFGNKTQLLCRILIHQKNMLRPNKSLYHVAKKLLRVLGLEHSVFIKLFSILLQIRSSLKKIQ